ncbi:MAG: hypothetical protein JSS25_00170 [Proteobacteria bacterium]|nr:hypothetical protein [Pseudomonadota bacterium]
MTVDEHAGLYREILTRLDKTATDQADGKFHTFSVGDPFYSTYINIGIWNDLESFDSAIGKYIPDVKIEEKSGRRTQTVELEEFEFKLRERVVLEVVGSRGGELPPATVT